MIGGIIMSGSSKFFFILSGIVSIILGIFLLLNPVINLSFCLAFFYYLFRQCGQLYYKLFYVIV